ncbi:MAG: ferredoxin [Ignavibacteriae bacterium HGW-Ignavibacteriae-2]|nr:ferredoxin family protein [Bacteroidota bacterium]PKL89989.1 MAG: ferredoxin [Ignavibacteriae bacterium HGW-Ignavibacteriae-2]
MAKVKGDIVIDIEKCKGCELCMDACPQDSLERSKQVNKKGYLYIVKVEDNCTGCTNCALVCPDGVITVYRQTAKNKEQIAKITNVTGDITVTVKE